MRTVNSATSARRLAPVPPIPDTAARWERADGRYYLVHLHLDLFGSLVVTKVWGGIGTRRGRVRHLPVATRAEAARLLREVRHRRRQRGYVRRHGLTWRVAPSTRKDDQS